MARKVEEIVEEVAAEVPALSTIGALLPGFSATVAGVDVGSLPLGLLYDLVTNAVEAEVTKAEVVATRGLKKEDDEELHASLRSAARSSALSAFSIGVLPSDLPDERDFISTAAVNFVKADIATKAKASGNVDAFEARWFEMRMTAEEAEDAAKPRSHARANCIKRVAREWLAKDEESLPEAARSIRARVIAEGQMGHAAALAGAQARVRRAGATLLSPLDAPTSDEAPVAVQSAVDTGF